MSDGDSVLQPTTRELKQKHFPHHPTHKLTNDLKALSFVLNERSLTLLKEEQKFDFEKRLLLSSPIMSSLCFIYNKLLNWPSRFHLFWTLVPVYLNTCTWKIYSNVIKLIKVGLKQFSV